MFAAFAMECIQIGNYASGHNLFEWGKNSVAGQVHIEQFCWIWDGPGWVISDWVRHRLGLGLAPVLAVKLMNVCLTTEHPSL